MKIIYWKRMLSLQSTIIKVRPAEVGMRFEIIAETMQMCSLKIYIHYSSLFVDFQLLSVECH